MGLRPEVPQPAAWGEGIYGAEHHRRTYDELHRRAAERLRAGGCVILDASYRERAWRRDARDTARRAGAPFLLLETTCPEPVVRERLSRRAGGPSDGRLELLDAQRRASEPVGGEIPSNEHAVIDAAAPLADAVAVALHRAYRHRLEV
jgi:predicted kinase